MVPLKRFFITCTNCKTPLGGGVRGRLSHNIDPVVSKAHLLSVQVAEGLTSGCATHNPWGKQCKIDTICHQVLSLELALEIQ